MIIYKGTDLTLPFTLEQQDGTAIPFTDVTVSVELNIKDRVLKTYTSEGGTVKPTDTANVCKINLLSAETVSWPVGKLRAVITVGFEDTDYPDDVRHEIVAVDVHEVREAK